MLIRYLLRIVVFSLSLTTTLNLTRNYSIILLKANAVILSVIIYSLEESLGSFKDLSISY
jgi:hypothetical protein